MQHLFWVLHSGKASYAKCMGCHGAKGEKKAMNVSKVIGGQSVAETKNQLKGYKDGSYGGRMAGIMKGQVKRMNEAQMKELSEYIATL